MSNTTLANTTFTDSIYNYTLLTKEVVEGAISAAVSYVPESISKSLDEVGTVAAGVFGGHLVGTTIKRAYNGDYKEAIKSGAGACAWIAVGAGLSNQFETNPAWMVSITAVTALSKLTNDYQNGQLAAKVSKITN